MSRAARKRRYRARRKLRKYGRSYFSRFAGAWLEMRRQQRAMTDRYIGLLEQEIYRLSGVPADALVGYFNTGARPPPVTVTIAGHNDGHETEK